MQSCKWTLFEVVVLLDILVAEDAKRLLNPASHRSGSNGTYPISKAPLAYIQARKYASKLQLILLMLPRYSLFKSESCTHEPK